MHYLFIFTSGDVGKAARKSFRCTKCTQNFFFSPRDKTTSKILNSLGIQENST